MKLYKQMGLPMAALALLSAGFIFTGTAQASAIITNGTVTLGVNDQGHLNAPGGPSSPGFTGVYFNATGNEATSPGCLCEGWGAGIFTLGVSGYANEDEGGAFNLALVSFTSTASTAVSVVTISSAAGAPLLQVTHNYSPSASANLYQVDVTLKNVSGAVLGSGATDLRYRRVMDWDIEPTAFSEFVTIGGLPASNVLFTGDDGFTTANPLGSTGSDIAGCDFNVNFTDCGPEDHGAIFDFGFPSLAIGGEQSFKIFYGAAATEAAADLARAVVGAEVYSYGQCDPASDTTCNITTGAPNTFIFAFAGVGGTPPPPPGVPEPATLLLMGAGLAGLASFRKRKKS